MNKKALFQEKEEELYYKTIKNNKYFTIFDDIQKDIDKLS
jgi:hypothetical protein